MSLFSRGSSSATYGAVFYVGSGSVGVAIVESDEHKKLPNILFSHKVIMRTPKGKVSKDDLLRRMREALFSASLILSKNGLRELHERNPKARVSKILVTASSPWAHTVSKQISYEHDERMKVTSTLLRDLVEGAEEEVLRAIEENSVSKSLGFEIVERATVEVKINGYSVHNPIGLSGKSLSLSHTIGLIQEDVLTAIYEVQDKIFPETEVTAHTFMLVNYCILRDFFPNMQTYSIIDVTGEATEIGIVEDGSLTSTTHTTYGSNTLVRKGMAEADGTQESVLSLLRAYAEKTLDEREIPKIDETVSDYSLHIRETLTKLHKQTAVPRTIVITAPPQLEQFFGTIIPSVVSDVTMDTPKVLLIAPKILSEITEKASDDVFISITSRFFHKLHGCGNINDA